MITIEKETTSTIYVTFRELMLTPATSIPLVVMTNETNLEKVAFLLPINLSPSTRYDQYEITETSVDVDIDPANGIINLRSPGFWKYEAFEFDPNDPFDPNNYTTGRSIEIGRANVIGNELLLHEAYR